MDDDYATSLRREFGYAPDESSGEKWVVYRDEALLIFHPDRRIRVYRRGSRHDQDYFEVEPLPEWI